MTNEELQFCDKIALEVAKSIVSSAFFERSIDDQGPDATIKGVSAFAYGMANEMIRARKEMT